MLLRRWTWGDPERMEPMGPMEPLEQMEPMKPMESLTPLEPLEPRADGAVGADGADEADGVAEAAGADGALNPTYPVYMQKKWCRKIDAKRPWHGPASLKGKRYMTDPNSCTCTAPTPILATQGGTQVAYRYLSRHLHGIAQTILPRSHDKSDNTYASQERRDPGSALSFLTWES